MTTEENNTSTVGVSQVTYWYPYIPTCTPPYIYIPWYCPDSSKIDELNKKIDRIIERLDKLEKTGSPVSYTTEDIMNKTEETIDKMLEYVKTLPPPKRKYRKHRKSRKARDQVD